MTYTQGVADAICERLSAGESLNAICKTPGMPPESTVRGWAMDNVDGFAAKYARARSIGLDVIAEEIIAISDDGTNDYVETADPDNPGYAFNGEHVQRSKLRVDARKWFLSKLKPEKYGDRSALEVSGSLDIGQAILAARKRTDAGE